MRSKVLQREYLIDFRTCPGLTRRKLEEKQEYSKKSLHEKNNFQLYIQKSNA
jgi:hypothetical protein